MAIDKSTFEPGEIDVMKYILNYIYPRLEFDHEKKRYFHNLSDIELTIEEYVNLQSVLEKLGVTIF